MVLILYCFSFLKFNFNNLLYNPKKKEGSNKIKIKNKIVWKKMFVVVKICLFFCVYIFLILFFFNIVFGIVARLCASARNKIDYLFKLF